MVYNRDKDRFFSSANDFLNITSSAKIALNDLTAHPDDVKDIERLTVTVSASTYQAGDALRGPAWDTSFNGIAMTFDTSTGTLTLSGLATAELYQAALQGVQFFTDEGMRDVNRGNQRGIWNSDNEPLIAREGTRQRTLDIIAYAEGGFASSTVSRTVDIRRAGLAYTDASAGAVAFLYGRGITGSVRYGN